MSEHHHHLLDLPDEIFLMIFKELKMLDVLYFIADVHQRLNRIAHDSLYILQLDLTALTTIQSRCTKYVTDEQVLSHLCQNILPRLHEQIHRITLEPYLMTDILAAVNYPQLYSLSLRNF